MAIDRDEIYRVLEAAAAEVNVTQPPEGRLEPVDSALLTGDGGHLSSLSVITFILAVEEKLSEALQRPIPLFDEALIANPQGAFRTIGTLADHIQTILEPPAA